MLDETLKTEKKESTKFEVVPEGIYQVELLDITSKEVETYDYKQYQKLGQSYLDKKKITADRIRKNEVVLSFQFAILAGDQRLRSVWSNFIPNMLYISMKNGKNKLYKIVEALNGKELSQEEEATMGGKFLNGLLGKQCNVVVEHSVSGENTFANPVNWVKVSAMLPALSVEEKEGCKVKPKDGSVAIDDETGQPFPEEQHDTIRAEDIPF